MAVAVPWYAWRAHVIHSMPVPVDQNIFSTLNNSLADAVTVSEKIASAAHLQLLYFVKLLFPVNLTHDYSYNSIPVIDLTNWKGLLGLVAIVALLTFAFIRVKEKNLYAFGILWFFIFIAPVSNFFFLIGATFAERFLYTPSLGFSILTALLLIKFMKDRERPFSFKTNKFFHALFAAIIFLYCFQTFFRNTDWKNNETLFAADVVKAGNSARANYNYGTALYEKAKKLPESPAKTMLLTRAQTYLLKAEKIYPSYIEALNNIGSAYFELQEYEKAAEIYKKILHYMPEHHQVNFNIATAYEKMSMFPQAADHYFQFGKRGGDDHVIFHAAIMYGNAGKMDEAISVLNYLVARNPAYSDAYLNLGQAYGMQSDFKNSELAFRKYLELHPNDLDALLGLATTIYKTGKKDDAAEIFNNVLVRDPSNTYAQQMLAEIKLL